VQERARLASRRLFPVVVTLIVLATIGTFLVRNAMWDNYRHYPIWLVVPLATVALVILQWRYRRQDADLFAWVTSSGLMLALLASTGVGLYPNLLPSNPHPARSLTIYNSYSSPFALQVGLIWLAFGLVIALAHTGWVYYLFRGKVKLDAGSHY
jgi:cytochrome d ubiquinol oxidase subunit II